VLYWSNGSGRADVNDVPPDAEAAMSEELQAVEDHDVGSTGCLHGPGVRVT